MACFMRKVILCLYVVMPLLLLSSSYTHAVMIGLSTEELTKASHVVILGTVESVQSLWSSDGRTIFSRATILVSDTAKGNAAGEKIAVEYDGGEVGGVGLKVSDSPTLAAHERIILFLKTGSARNPEAGQPDGQKTFNVVGKAQGKYRIDEKGVARKGGFSVASGEDRLDNNIPYQELLDKVRAVP
jgi:hypothetical protein